ncbi:MAG: SCO family protein [Phycisphaerales bacterium]|jgi:protein SCO1/2
MSQKRLFMAIVVVALIFLGLVGTLIMMQPRAVTDAEMKDVASDPLQPDEMLVGYSIPEFELTNQDGQLVDQSILEGEITILAFIFTNCPFACPGMTGQMLQHQAALEGSGVRFLSISVDPANDTPEVLKAYGDRNGMDFDRWNLLTGPFEDVRSIVRDSLNFFVGEDTTRQITLPDGGTMNNVSHPSHLILVGPDREVLGIYLYYEVDRMTELRGRARAAARAIEGN